MKLASSDLADLADFLLIYIEEAHPSEKKHFEENIVVKEHKALKDRINAAEMLVEVAGEEEFPCPIVVDKMDNAASHAYGALPERLFIVKDGAVVFVGGEGPYLYDINKMEKKLREIVLPKEY